MDLRSLPDGASDGRRAVPWARCRAHRGWLNRKGPGAECAAPRRAWTVRRAPCPSLPSASSEASAAAEPRAPLRFGPVLIVGLTSLPSRLAGAVPTLRSIAAQERRPDRLILSLPRRSHREGLDYALPDGLRAVLSEHSWMEVHWLDADSGPGTKLLGALDWLGKNQPSGHRDDVLMVLDDDHVYKPYALAELLRAQRSRGPECVTSFFTYFFRGIMVPQGADIIALHLEQAKSILDYHARFVADDSACFLVDDLWIGMYHHLCGKQVVSLRNVLEEKGDAMVYTRTNNAKVAALESLEGDDRRDRVMLRAFDSLLERLLKVGADVLEPWGGAGAQQRLKTLMKEVSFVERRIMQLSAYIQHELRNGADPRRELQRPQEELAKMRHLYQMQAAQP